MVDCGIIYPHPETKGLFEESTGWRAIDFSKHCLPEYPRMCIRALLARPSMYTGSLVCSDSLQASCETFISFEGSKFGY